MSHQPLTNDVGSSTQSSDDKASAEKTHTTEEQTLQPLPRSATKSVLITAACTLAMILNTANATAVSIAVPTIGRDLDIKETQLQWLTSAYSLSSGCMLLFLGRIADLYGRKLTFLSGIAVIGVLGLGCGFAKNDITILVLRGLQGVGGAAAIPAALGILAGRFPPSPARGRAFATFAAGAPIGAGFGTIIGGVLTQFTSQSWRSTFYLLFGISFLTFAFGLASIDRDESSTIQDRRVDWLGAALVTSGLVLIDFVLSNANVAPQGWKTSYIIALLIVGVILVALFVIWQAYLERAEGDSAEIKSMWRPPPLMKLSIWSRADGKLAVMLVVAFLEWCSFLTFVFWVQLYYQDFRQLSPIATTIRLIPMFVTGLICNFLVAIFVGKVDFAILVVTGTTMTALANLLFAVIRIDSPYWAFAFPATIISVFGADFVFPTGSIFVAKVSLPHEQSVSGALLQTMMQLGGSFGLAITTIIFNSSMTRHSVRGTSPSSHTQELAYKAANWGGFAFGVFGALLAVCFLRGVGPVGHHANPQDEKGREESVEEVIDVTGEPSK